MWGNHVPPRPLMPAGGHGRTRSSRSNLPATCRQRRGAQPIRINVSFPVGVRGHGPRKNHPYQWGLRGRRPLTLMPMAAAPPKAQGAAPDKFALRMLLTAILAMCYNMYNATRYRPPPNLTPKRPGHTLYYRIPRGGPGVSGNRPDHVRGCVPFWRSNADPLTGVNGDAGGARQLGG
jgi:hypothetical protein